MPWARASSLHRHMVCPASCSLPQYDRGTWRPGFLQSVTPEQLTEREQTSLELDKQTVWGGSADWGTMMHAAKAGLPVPDEYRNLMGPHRERLWPARLGLHEIGMSFDCRQRTVDICVAGTADEIDAWKKSRGDDCVVGSVDWWAELPTGEPWIDDLKTGWQTPEVVTEQTKFYLMCRMRGAQFASWQTGRVSITHWSKRGYDSGDQPEPTREGLWKQLSRFTLDEFEEDLVIAWRRAIEQEPRAIPGIQCEYCPSALVCTRGRD